MLRGKRCAGGVWDGVGVGVGQGERKRDGRGLCAWRRVVWCTGFSKSPKKSIAQTSLFHSNYLNLAEPELTLVKPS
jgi:hypothetical protein